MTSPVRWILAIMIAVTSIGNVTASALQPDSATTFESELTGDVVDIGDSGEAYIEHRKHHVAHLNDGRSYETIVIHLQNSVIYVRLITGDKSPESWLDDYITSDVFGYPNHYVVLGQEVDSERAWYLSEKIDYFDFMYYGYHDFSRDLGNGYAVLVSVHAHESALDESVRWSKNNITVDGRAVLADADLDEIDAMLNGTSSHEPMTFDPFTSTVEDWSEFGLVSDTEWHGDLIGAKYQWDGERLRFPFELPLAIQYYAANGTNTLTLVTDDGTGQVLVTEFASDGIVDPQDWIDRWSSEEWLFASDNLYPAITSKVGDFQASIIYQKTPEHERDFYSIREVIVQPNGEVIILTILAPPQHMIDVYTDAMRLLTIDGETVAPSWTAEELTAWFPASSGDSAAAAASQESDDSTPSSGRTSRDSTVSQPGQAGDAMVAESSGVTIDLGASGEAVFISDQPTLVEGSQYTLETVTVEYGTTIVIIDVMDGNVDVDEYMLNAESDIAATFDYMDWLGGEWTQDHAWDVYSGAYKLDYREYVYLDLVHDPESGLFYGIGVYSSEEEVTSGIAWLQENVTINGQGILAAADTGQIDAVIDGSSQFEAEPVPMNETTVADWADAGLVSETEWQSPFTQTSLTWDGEHLVFPFAQDDALVASDRVTTLELRTNDRRGEIKITTAEVDYVPTDWVDVYTSGDYVDSQTGSGKEATVIDSHVSDETGGVILLHYTDFGHPVVMIMDVYVTPDGVTILTEISAAPEDIADVYAIFWDSVQANGDYYPLTWPIEDIEALDIES